MFPYISAAGGTSDNTAYYQYPFFVSSSLCIFAASLAFFCLPHIGQDTITHEDEKFREYLTANGWDVRQLGLKAGESVDSLPRRQPTEEEVPKE